MLKGQAKKFDQHWPKFKKVSNKQTFFPSDTSFHCQLKGFCVRPHCAIEGQGSIEGKQSKGEPNEEPG